MVPVIQENLKVVKRQVKGNSDMEMVLNILEPFITTNYMGKDYIFGPMVGNIMEIGKIIELKEKEFLNGLMAENILAIIKRIKNMDMEYLNGLMAKNIKDIGKMENKMEMGNVITQEKIYGLKELGKMEKNKLIKKMDYLK